jgi:hypothetical protein
MLWLLLLFVGIGHYFAAKFSFYLLSHFLYCYQKFQVIAVSSFIGWNLSPTGKCYSE